MVIASSEWVPTFDDKPVGENHLKGIEEAVPSSPIAEPLVSRKVLIFSATSGYRHGSIPTGKAALVRLGESTGAYESVVSDDPANFESEVLHDFDAVILLSPTQDFFMPNKKQKDQFPEEEWLWLKDRHNRLVDNLVQYVSEGGGLMAIHAASDACYSHKEYGEMVGGYFAGHPWMWNNNVTIVVEEPEHPTMLPVFADKPDFSLVEEIYKFRKKPVIRSNTRVLLSLDVERSDQVEKAEPGDYPVAWVQGLGEGRIFYTSIGHNKHIFTNPLMLKHYLAGIQFATGDLHGETGPR